MSANVRLTTRIVLDHASYNSVVMWLTFISLVSERAAPKHMRGTVRQTLWYQLMPLFSLLRSEKKASLKTGWQHKI